MYLASVDHSHTTRTVADGFRSFYYSSFKSNNHYSLTKILLLRTLILTWPRGKPADSRKRTRNASWRSPPLVRTPTQFLVPGFWFSPRLGGNTGPGGLSRNSAMVSASCKWLGPVPGAELAVGRHSYCVERQAICRFGRRAGAASPIQAGSHGGQKEKKGRLRACRKR